MSLFFAAYYVNTVSLYVKKMTHLTIILHIFNKYLNHQGMKIPEEEQSYYRILYLCQPIHATEVIIELQSKLKQRKTYTI